MLKINNQPKWIENIHKIIKETSGKVKELASREGRFKMNLYSKIANLNLFNQKQNI